MRPPLLCLPLLLAAAAPPAFTPTRDPGTTLLAADAENRWVPFDLTPGNQIRFAMQLDGRSVIAILDTGVSYSVLARRSAALVPAKVREGGSATAIGGAVAIGWMPTTSMTLGGLTRSGGGVTVADLPAVATGSARPVDLLIGRDLIGAQALDIDFTNRRFRLLRSGRMPFVGSVAPLFISPDRRIYESEIILGSARLKPMVVDTGDGSSVTVTARGWAQTGLSELPTTTAITFGLAGPVVSGLAIVPNLSLGPLQAHAVEVRIEPADGFSQTIATAGRIGSGFLQNYRVLLDPGAGRMVLSPGPDAGKPPLRSTSGLLVSVQGDRLRVLHVMRGGPAQAAGWREGDAICRVNGAPIPADYPSTPLANWSVAPAGTVVTLGMCDGRTRELTARSFY